MQKDRYKDAKCRGNIRNIALKEIVYGKIFRLCPVLFCSSGELVQEVSVGLTDQ